MTHTTWMSSYWSGSWRNRAAAIDGPPANVATTAAHSAPGFSFTVTPVAGVPGKSEASFVVQVNANAVEATEASTVAAPAVLASASPGPQ